MNILHLTHTDINSDSRILKEMQSISTYSSKYKVSGIGVTLDEEQHKTKKDNEIDIYSINLISRKWRFLPTILRHSCSLIELTSKMLFKAIKLKPQIIHCNDTLVLPLGVILKIFTGSGVKIALTCALSIKASPFIPYVIIFRKLFLLIFDTSSFVSIST